jgi:hypothetical protein
MRTFAERRDAIVEPHLAVTCLKRAHDQSPTTLAKPCPTRPRLAVPAWCETAHDLREIQRSE